MVSTKAKSDECVAGSNFLLPAGHGVTLYSDLYQAYNDELDVHVIHNYGAPVRVEDGSGQELFTVASDSQMAHYQSVDTVRAVCEGVGSDDCNISWNICGISSDLVVPPIPSLPPVGSIKVASPEDPVRNEELDKCIGDLIDDDNVSHATVGACYKAHAPCWPESATCSDQGEDPDGYSKLGEIILNHCPDDTVLTPFEMPVYDEGRLFVVGYETVYYCVEETEEFELIIQDVDNTQPAVRIPITIKHEI